MTLELIQKLYKNYLDLGGGDYTYSHSCNFIIILTGDNLYREIEYKYKVLYIFCIDDPYKLSFSTGDDDAYNRIKMFDELPTRYSSVSLSFTYSALRFLQ